MPGLHMFEHFTPVHKHESVTDEEYLSWKSSPNAQHVKNVAVAAFTDVAVRHHVALHEGDTISRVSRGGAMHTSMQEVCIDSCERDVNVANDSERLAAGLCQLFPLLIATRRSNDLIRLAAVCELLVEQARLHRTVIAFQQFAHELPSPVLTLKATNASPLLIETYAASRAHIDRDKMRMRAHYSFEEPQIAYKYIRAAERHAETLGKSLKVDEVEDDFFEKNRLPYYLGADNEHLKPVEDAIHSADPRALKDAYREVGYAFDSLVDIPKITWQTKVKSALHEAATVIELLRHMPPPPMLASW